MIREPHVFKAPFVEIIRPGAFTRTLRENKDIRALYDHDRGKPLGRTKYGTLDLVEDDKGLLFDLPLPDTQVGRDARESVRRGDMDGCSFHGYVIRDKFIDRPGKPTLREIFEIQLVEITPATAFPAYESTSVVLRSLRSATDPARPDHLSVGLASAWLRLSASDD